MTRFTSILLLILVACLVGCDSERDTYDGVKAPPATATTSVATEDIIAQRTAAQVAAGVASANISKAKAEQDAATANLAKANAEEKAAKSVAAKATADADLTNAKAALALATADAAAANKDKATANAKVEALTTSQDIQTKAELTGSFNRYLTLELFIIIGIALMIWEKNLKAAAVLGVIGAALLVGVFAMDFAVQHEGLILGVAAFAAAAIVVWHYRSKLGAVGAELAVLEAAVGKSNLLLSIENAFHTAEVDAKSFLLSAWLRIKGWAVTAETKGAAVLHLSGAVTVPTAPTPPSSTTGKA